MNRRRLLNSVLLASAISLAVGSFSLAADETNDELVSTVVGLLGDKDKDLRAVGLEQVRTSAKGAAATKQFSGQLAKIPSFAQEGLLSALSDRGDVSARPDIVALLNSSKDEPVRVAAISALGILGNLTDLKLLIDAAGGKSAAEQDAAVASLGKLKGDSVSESIAKELKSSPPALQIRLLSVLVARRSILDVYLDILPYIEAADPKVRMAAMDACGQFFTIDYIPYMMPGLFKAEIGPERDAAEKSVATACRRIGDVKDQAEPVLVWYDARAKLEHRLALLSTIGRIGGAKALSVVEAAIASKDETEHQAGIHALCMWPDSTVADRLMELTKSATDSAERAMTFKHYVRVGTVRGDKRTDAERFERVKQAMSIAKSPEEKNIVLQRARMAYLVESLRFLLPYTSQPDFAQMACESMVELAHHREIREPNKDEFDKALDTVIATSKDPVIIDRANRYKKGQTWLRPKIVDGP